MSRIPSKCKHCGRKWHPREECLGPSPFTEEALVEANRRRDNARTNIALELAAKHEGDMSIWDRLNIGRQADIESCALTVPELLGMVSVGRRDVDHP